MNKQTEEFRKKIVDAFIKSLEENPLEWKKNWQGPSGVPFNGASGRQYHGVNRFALQFISQEKGYEDPRWYTFKQVNDAKLKIRKGSHGCKVEYWFLWDRENRKNISMDEYVKLSAEDKEKITWTAKYYTVFNGSQIEGILPYEIPKQEINPAEVIQTISQNIGVEIAHDGDDKAFYRPAEDKIHLPLPEHFFSDYDYNATALHELAHSTGHETRLNRDLTGGFGSASYAKEELIAELTSCFMSAELPAAQSQEHLKNHQAYIQGWISELKEKPESLMQAVKYAEKAAAYLEKAGGLIKEAEEVQTAELQENNSEKKTEKTEEISKDQKEETALPEKISLKEFLARKGLDAPISDWTTDKTVLPKGETNRGQTRRMREGKEEIDRYHAKRSEAISEYYAKVRNGEITAPTMIDRAAEIASGNPNSPAVQAARRLLEKYDIRIKESGKELLYTDGMPGVTVGPHRFFTKDGCLNYYKKALELVYEGEGLTMADTQMLSQLESDLVNNAGFNHEELEKLETDFLKSLSQKKEPREEKTQSARRRNHR